MAQDNPYAPPSAHVEDVVESSSEAETIRREHIKHEASIRAVGLLYYIGGGFLIIGGVTVLIAMSAGPGRTTSALLPVLGPTYVVVGVLTLTVAYGLRTLRPWARLISIVFACIGLLGFPVGTLINIYVLWLLLSKKGRRIFEDDYPAIVAATPDVKYRTSMILWIILGILLLAIVAAIMIPTLNR